MNITVVGSGYVGLVTGASLAQLGNHVTCLDVDLEKIQLLEQGKVPFYEPGLEELIQQLLASKKLRFTTSYEISMEEAEVCFLALPTPSKQDGTCDFSYVLAATKELSQYIKKYLLVINKSTVPVGTTESVRITIEEVLRERSVTVPFDVVSNPEFLQEGSAVHNAMNPDRIVLGLESKKALDILQELYAPFLDRMQVMDIPSAELSKYAANAMLAMRISFMNHFSSLCEKVGADIEALRRTLAADPRIGSSYLNAGIGFGGSCLPKDVAALCSTAKAHKHPSALFEEILQINEEQKKRFFHKILSYFGSLQGKTLAIWGLSFKPHTDDLRSAPSLDLIQMATEHGAKLRLFDPVAIPSAKQLLANSETITFCHDEYDAATGADAIVLITEWPIFRSVELQKVGALMRNKAFFDGRNQYDGQEMQNFGFDYICIGKKGAQEHAWQR